MIRKKILLLVMASVFGMSEVGTTYCQAGENCSFNLTTNGLTKTDVSPVHIHCTFQSNTQGTPKKFYRIINNVDVLEFQDEQFAGRVQFDKKELKEGRFTFHLSNVTPNDSGKYICDLGIIYNTQKKYTTVLTVNQTNDGENNNTTPSNSGMVALNGKTRPSEDQNSSTGHHGLDGIGLLFVPLALVLFLVPVVQEHRRRGHEWKRSEMQPMNSHPK